MYEPTNQSVFEVVGRYSDKWKYFYPDAQEMMPRHMPDALDKYFEIKGYVYVNHAGKTENRRSHSGIIIYINIAPIIWCSKLQNTVGASIFRSESVSLRIDTGMIEALRYKLRCFWTTSSRS